MADALPVEKLAVGDNPPAAAPVAPGDKLPVHNNTISNAPKTPEDKFALITKGLEEVLNPEIIKEILPKRDLKIYWGTATTGRPHVAYFLPAIHMANFLAAGCELTVLLADIHGFLDNLKAPIEIVQHRAIYYKFCITAIMKAVGVPTDKLRFVLGSSYQKSPEYCMDVYRIAALTSEHDSKRAGAEVVKQSDNAPLSSLIYPLMQALDEEHLGCDAQFGGTDQRKIFALAKDALPKLGYKTRAHMMNKMIPGLQGSKMSASDPDSKIDILDPPEVVRKKIKKAFAAPKIVEDNGLLAFLEYVLLPAAALKGRSEFIISRERDGLEPLVYASIEKIQEDYRNDVLNPQLIKPAITDALLELMETIQADYQASKEWQDITLKAYPPAEPAKKVKKVKDKGTRHPGAAGKAAEAPAADGSTAA